VSARQPGGRLVTVGSRRAQAGESTSSPTTYYGIWIKGTWKSPIDAGANPLPPHASYSTSYTPIPPGSSDGVDSLAYVVVQVSPDTPVGLYTLGVWASDGTMMQSVPVTLRVQTSKCRYGLNP
jgi:hypothetical protein